MAYKPDTKALAILRYPLPIAFSICLLGLIGGYFAQGYFGNGLFERFGSLTAGLGAFVFGIAAAELLIRSQVTFIMGDDGEAAAPFKARTVRFALDCQAAVVLVGTIQWGFGGLLFGNQ